jgi:manganese efflux pump family protein
MRIATLICWVVTASLGGFMLRTWLASGGLRRERAREGGLPPQLIFGHMGLALTGLVLWIAYSASSSRVLCWAAVAILTGVIALGICTVTLWTPYPARRHPDEAPRSSAAGARPPSGPSGPSGSSGPAAAAGQPGAGAESETGFTLTDEMINEFLDDPFPPSRSARGQFAAIIPVVHGLAALTTFVLAVMTAALTRT